MTALGPDRLVVTWTERFVPEKGDLTEDNVKAVVLVNDPANKILTPLNQGTRVNSVAEGVQRQQCVAADMDMGIIGFAWIDDSVEGSQVNRRSVKARTSKARCEHLGLRPGSVVVSIGGAPSGRRNSNPVLRKARTFAGREPRPAQRAADPPNTQRHSASGIPNAEPRGSSGDSDRVSADDPPSNELNVNRKACWARGGPPIVARAVPPKGRPQCRGLVSYRRPVICPAESRSRRQRPATGQVQVL
jgi:hypothetical protein